MAISENKFNVEQGVFGVLLLLLVAVIVDATLFMPVPEELTPATVKNAPIIIPVDEMNELELADAKSRDPFMPNELNKYKSFTIKNPVPPKNNGVAPPPPPPPPPPPVEDVGTVKLPPKPKKETKQEEVETFPLKIIGIVKLKKNVSEYSVIIKDPDGNYDKLPEDAEYPVGEKVYRVLKVTATRVTFESETGKLFTFDRDPMKRKDQSEDAQESSEEGGAKINFKDGGGMDVVGIENAPGTVALTLDESGLNRIVLEADNVKRPEYDYELKFNALKPDDYMGHYNLGRWCARQATAQNGLLKKALERYEYCAGKRRIPKDVYLRIGSLHERATPPNYKRALAAFEKYRKYNSKSSIANNGAKRTREILRTQSTKGQPAAEGMENFKWVVMGSGNPVKTRTAIDLTNRKTIVLESAFKGGGKDKTGVQRGLRGNLANQTALMMDVYNPEDRPIDIAIALIAGNRYEWFESRTMSIPAKSWRIGVRFNLKSKTWKSQASRWQHKVAPSGMNRPRSMLILIFDRKKPGKLYFDAMRFASD